MNLTTKICTFVLVTIIAIFAPVRDIANIKLTSEPKFIATQQKKPTVKPTTLVASVAAAPIIVEEPEDVVTIAPKTYAAPANAKKINLPPAIITEPQKEEHAAIKAEATEDPDLKAKIKSIRYNIGRQCQSITDVLEKAKEAAETAVATPTAESTTTPAPTVTVTPAPEQEETVVKTTTTPTPTAIEPEPTTTPAPTAIEPEPTTTPAPTAIEPEPTTTPVPTIEVPTSTPEPEDFTSSIEEDYIKVQTWLEQNGYETKYKKDAGVVFCSDTVTPASRVVYGNDMWTILIEYSDGYKKIKRIQSNENIMSYLEMVKEYTPAAN